MRGRLIAIGLFVASLVALAVGAIVPACYSPPQPACGFVCGAQGACPADYTCAAMDNRCHLDGVPVTSCELIDAGIGLEFVGFEGIELDAPPIDAVLDAPIDAPVDGALPDAALDGALPDAALDGPPPDVAVDAPPPDAAVDAAPVVDAMDDAAVMADASQDAPADAIAADAATD